MPSLVGSEMCIRDRHVMLQKFTNSHAVRSWSFQNICNDIGWPRCFAPPCMCVCAKTAGPLTARFAGADHSSKQMTGRRRSVRSMMATKRICTGRQTNMRFLTTTTDRRKRDRGRMYHQTTTIVIWSSCCSGPHSSMIYYVMPYCWHISATLVDKRPECSVALHYGAI